VKKFKTKKENDMKKRPFQKIALGGRILLIALIVLVMSALADFSGPYECQNWSSTVLSGPLTVEINPTMGPSPSIEFSYEAPKPYYYTYRKSAFKTVAAYTSTIEFDWEYYFHHSWFQVYADLWVYADGPSGRTEQHLVDFYQGGYTGPKTFEGSASLDVTEGYEFGLEVGGSNFDYSQILEGMVTLTNFNFGLAVLIDIKPGSYPNSFNANGNGVIPIAILGSADLDVTQIDPSTLSFEGAAVRVKGNGMFQCSLEDVSSHQGPPDGYLDLVCQFVDDFTEGWVIGDGSATVTGKLFDGTFIFGSDSISIVQ
jgi:hypothetical protein